MGLTWGAAWFVAGLLLARVPGFFSDVPFAILFAPLGFLTGVVFSAILVAIESRQRLRHNSIARFAGWGAASGLLLAGLPVLGAALRGGSVLSEFVLFGPPLAIAGAACAAGSLALAQRADRGALRGADGEPVELERNTGQEHNALERGD